MATSHDLLFDLGLILADVGLLLEEGDTLVHVLVSTHTEVIGILGPSVGVKRLAIAARVHSRVLIVGVGKPIPVIGTSLEWEGYVEAGALE